MMHLRRYRLFNDVAMLRSISKAARQNGLSQSAASQIIRSMEKEAGRKLVDTSVKPLDLTREGYVFWSFCTRLVESSAEMERQFAVLSWLGESQQSAPVSPVV